MNRICLLIFSLLVVIGNVATADNLTLSIDGSDVELTGEILITAQDESLYFRANDGRIWFVKPEQIKQKTDDDSEIKPISAKQLGENLLAELPAGFRVFQTKHYVIAYQNEVAYARWIGGLYESRLYRGFEAFWEKKQKLPLAEPAFPLVAIIFGSADQYHQYVERELGAGQSMIAYYNLETNRVTMYDLTADYRSPTKNLDERQIEDILQTPAVIPMVATIIHEGTHQLIFNRGMQTRFAESPLWLNEGLAMYFETPALRSNRGWTKPGLVSDLRLFAFLKQLPNRPSDSLTTMIQSDVKLRDSETAADAYAEAWAFNHFLLRHHSEEYVQYLQFMSTKKALKEDTPETRLADFQQFFGDDLEKLDAEFVEYGRRLR